jgi:hypothetical protein
MTPSVLKSDPSGRIRPGWVVRVIAGRKNGSPLIVLAVITKTHKEFVKVNSHAHD